MPKRTFAIGDVHGCREQFESLIDAIAPAADDHIVLLGDCVDRGPDSAGVLKQVIRLTHTNRVTFIRGNHEQMMLDARQSHEALSEWIRNGGDETLKSYAGVRGALRDVPEDHWYLLKTGTVDYLETESHILVHANAYPDLPMPEQPEYMLRWERCDQILPHGSAKTIVCGHTPQKAGRIMNRGFAICLDTGAGHGGPLSCLELNSGRVWQAQPGGRVERSHVTDYSEE